MKKNFLTTIIKKGKLLLEKANPIAREKAADIAAICTGFREEFVPSLVKDLPNESYYFKGNMTSSDLPNVFLAVVGFDHKKGSIIEYAYPEECQMTLLKKDMIDFANRICFAAIPDAAHTMDSDYCFFIAHCSKQLWYGVSCFRQIDEGEGYDKEKSLRHYIQKAVCLLSRVPLFTLMQNKLHPTTLAYFQQRDFKDRKILHDLYVNLTTSSITKFDYSTFQNGLPLKQVVTYFKENVFVLLKLLILERKIIFYSKSAGVVTTCILSLLALIPGIIAFGGSSQPSELLNAFLKAEEMHGLPLHIYHDKVILLPMFSLNDLDLLKGKVGYTIGTTNILISQLPQIEADAIINIDKNEIKIGNKEFKKAVSLSDYDKRVIAKLLKASKPSVTKTPAKAIWVCNGNTEEDALEQYVGSNEFIMKKFAKYFHKLLINYSVAKFIYKDYESVAAGNENSSPAAKTTNLLGLKTISEEINTKLKKYSEDTSEQKEDVKSRCTTASQAPPPVMLLTEKPTHSPSIFLKKDPKLESEEKEEINELKKEHLTEKEKIIKKILKPYNLKWLIAWQNTINNKIWEELHSPTLFALSKFIDIVTPSTVYYENGDIYIGDICKGKRNGTGTLLYENGTNLYEGDWKDDKRDGIGHQTDQEGQYSGQFSFDLFNGSGTYKTKTGVVYEGEWVNNLKSGMGHLKFPNGDSYVGEMKNDQMQGKGQYIYATGDIFNGQFYNNLKHGFGQLISSKGNVTEGNWILDKIESKPNKM